MTEPESQPVDPTTEPLERAKSQIEKGDFLAARRLLKREYLQPDQERFRAFEKRLNVDAAALVVAAICGVTIAVVATLTLFH